MRLTLRTMLAYLDGILAPEDAQDIGKKIEESTFASDLIRRIRDLLRRPIASAPDTESQESSLGPNTMAEYLDNTLSPNRVTEFEKICLESDIHLAEVAACHQILTLVLGEPAEIEPASRQRMYDISTKLAAEEIPFSNESQNNTNTVIPPPFPSFSASSTDEDTDQKRAKPTIPDYLREPAKKYRWLSIATASVVAVCLLTVLLMLLGRFEPGTTMGNMLVRLGVVQDRTAVAVNTNKKVPGSDKPQPDASAKPKPDQQASVPELKKPAPSTGQVTSPAPPETESIKQSGGDKSLVTTAPSMSETVESPEKSGSQSETLSKAEATGNVSKSKNPAGPAPNTADQGPSRSGDASKDSAATSQQPSGGKTTDGAVGPSETKPPEEKNVPVSERLGRFVSDDQILLINFGAPTDWQRAENKEFLTANERLLALPTYRPDITLGAGVNLQMLGGTELELISDNAQEPPGIKIRFGRIVAKPLANAGTRLRIIVGDRSGVITFADPEAVIAADVRRIHARGANPETETARFATEFYVTSGHVLWDETGQKTLEITGPARLVMIDQTPPDLIVAKEFPMWITSEPISKLESRASSTMAKVLLDLAPNRPAQRGLMELAEHRQKEVRVLAIRCLAYIGHFDPMVKILADAEFKQDWSDNIDQLCKAVARDPDSALAVRQSLENRYPQTAADMYRMLWGYSDEGLASGEDEKLVNFLENDNLALRVLSLWNLKDITGKGGQYYQPEQTQAKRQQPVKNWKKSLENKEIRIKSTEEKGGSAAREKAAQLTGND